MARRSPVKFTTSGVPEDGGEIKIGVRTKLYDDRDRFMAEVKKVAAEAFADIATEGRAAAESLQPTPSGKEDPRSDPISASFWEESGETYAKWGNNARHALAVEKGTKRHDQTAQVTFFWEKEGRRWKASKDDVQQIDHPPTDAKPFLRPSFHYIAEHWKEIFKRHAR